MKEIIREHLSPWMSKFWGTFVLFFVLSLGPMAQRPFITTWKT